jgi:hypothetical protein
MRAHHAVTTRRAMQVHGLLLQLGWASRAKPWARAGPLLSTGFRFSFSFIFSEIYINFKNA